MTREEGENSFTAALDLTGESLPLAYKYVVWNAVKSEWVRFEDGEDRTLHETADDDKLTVVNDGFIRLPDSTWHGAGVAIPVFSLRSERGFGVGEFTDLMLLVDWATRTDLKLIQILPINDTTATHTWADSYPYAGISAFALHPIYLDLAKVAGKNHAAALKLLEPERLRLNALDALDYEAVARLQNASGSSRAPVTDNFSRRIAIG
jgi:4-alpha-glucanotransferase